MSLYYKYSFISPSVIFSSVQEELKSYFDSGAVDDLMFGSWLDKCVRKIGKSSYSIKSTVLHIDNFKAKLPVGFISVREAWLCVQTHGLPYRSSNSFYSQAGCQETIKIEPIITNTGQENCNSCTDCMPDEIKVVYKTNNELNRSYKKHYLLKPGNISVLDNCSMDCLNYGSNGPDTFDINGNDIVTNFRNGSVYLQYYASDVDEDNFQMIPDNYRIREYIEAFIKFKCFEMLSNQINDESFNQIQQKLIYYKQASDEAYILADIEIKKQDVYSKARAIVRQRHSLDMYRTPDRNKFIWKR